MDNKQCKKCGESKELRAFRNKWHKGNQKYYRLTTCIACERITTKKHQEANRDKWREYNNKAYLNMSEEQKQKKNLRSNVRHKRLRAIPWDEELTNFVTEEAHHLRGLRDAITGFKWHVDHIVPLNGKSVSGLHVWNNLAVIPALTNLSKGNKLCRI